MDTQLPQETQKNIQPPKVKKPSNKKKIRKILFYAVLIILGAGAAYAIISNPKTGWIPTLAYIVFASIVFTYRKPIIEGKQKLTQPDMHQVTATPTLGAVTPEVSATISQAPRAKLKLKHIFTLVGIGLGGLIILFIIVSLFQPRMYLWFVTSQAQADHEVTSTTVDVIRTLTAKETTEGADPGTATQTIALNTDTKYVAPSSWAFVTRAKSESQGLDEGVEVIVMGETAYQRTADTTDEYTTYQFAEGEYDSTAKAIEGSSFFQKGILEFMKTPRFVFNTDGQPWWMLHYRIPVNIDALDAAAPDWYSSDIYAFAKDPSLTNQQVEFSLDLWINPFTRHVAHEQWMVTKVSNDDAQYTVQLNIFMDRTFSYPKNLTIDAPENTTTPTTTE
jgi:hypothetical protein